MFPGMGNSKTPSVSSAYRKSTIFERTKLKISSLKTTILVDKNSTILDIHVTTTRKHDTQIAPNLIKRNQNKINTLL